ncbi:MAG: phosphopentomutase [Clostridia bacterium]|nr:phosphopentomutase [Clostridia bacterium]
MKRVFLIVLDSFGIGAMPDAAAFGDENSNTLAAICNQAEFDCPNLRKLGLFAIDGVRELFPYTTLAFPLASYARLAEASAAKDTTAGHWEIAGLVSDTPFPTYPNGFPAEVIAPFEAQAGKKVLCNKPYSGTDVIRDYGKEHLKTGNLIVYTSGDSVFQIAAHEDVVPVEELYRYCEIARGILTGKHAVGRVIARPFTGDYPYTRTPRRHDFSVSPPKDTLLDLLKTAGYQTIGVGKIGDIFAGKGVTESHPTKSNADGMQTALALQKREFEGLCFINLVDFDSQYGHRNDAKGYARAMMEFDGYLGEFLSNMQEEDVLIITADHGCDPITPSTDHSREYVPMLVCGAPVKAGVNLGTRPTFADISATVLDYFGVAKNGTAGQSFLSQIKR